MTTTRYVRASKSFQNVFAVSCSYTEHGLPDFGDARRRCQQSRHSTAAKFPNDVGTERDSWFRIGMKNAFVLPEAAFLFYPFVWSGCNSVYARDDAARSLAKLLVDAFEAFPKDDFVVIAHSHGGNVALKALHYLGESANRLFVITMGTPFLQIHVNEKLTRGLSVESTILTFSLVLFIGGWMEQYEVIAGFLDGWWEFPALMGFCGVVSAFLTFFVINPDYFGSRWCRRPAKIAEAAAYDLRRTPPARLLVLRSYDDEASLSLAAGAIATRVTNSFVGRILPISIMLLGFGIIALIGLGATVPSLKGTLWPLAALPLAPAPTVFMYAGLIAFLIGIIPAAFKGVFGRELLVGAARCEISAESVPDISDGMDVTTLRPDRFLDMITKRHAVYDNRACHTTIADWIRRFVEPPISMLPYPEIDGQDWIAAHRRFFPPEASDRA